MNTRRNWTHWNVVTGHAHTPPPPQKKCTPLSNRPVIFFRIFFFKFSPIFFVFVLFRRTWRNVRNCTQHTHGLNIYIYQHVHLLDTQEQHTHVHTYVYIFNMYVCFTRTLRERTVCQKWEEAHKRNHSQRSADNNNNNNNKNEDSKRKENNRIYNSLTWHTYRPIS